MNRLKHSLLLLLTAIAMFSCGDDYDDTELRNDVNDLKSRVEKLESWCSTANTQISALQGLISALQENDYVTGVTPIMEGAKETGYTITFAKSKSITILHGKDGKDGLDGETPLISVQKADDGLYYWTVKTSGDTEAQWLTDAEGNKIAASARDGKDGVTPEISIATADDGQLYWKLNGEWLLSAGNKVPASGVKGDKGDKGDQGDKGDKGDKGDQGDTGATGPAGSAGTQGPAGLKGEQGDAIFKKDGIDTSNDEYVIFTLADGTTLKLARATDITVTLKDVKDEMFISPDEVKIGKKVDLVLPIKEEDYKVITAEITSKGGTDTDIVTSRAAGDIPTPWTVKLNKPLYNKDGTLRTAGNIVITPGKGVAIGDQAKLKLTITDTKNIDHVTVIIITYTDAIPVTGVTMGKGTLDLIVGEEETLTATLLPMGAKGQVSWTSSDATIATVDGNGRVKSLKKGVATITATVMTADGEKTATCDVTVTEAPVPYAWYTANPDADIFTLTNRQDLKEFAKLVNGDSEALAAIGKKEAYSFAGKTINLTKDIDLSSEAWSPIGESNNENAKSFQGTFDGQGHMVTIKSEEEISEPGIFGNLYNAVIKNLAVAGSIKGKYAAGGIAAHAAGGTCMLINCINRAQVTSPSRCGGILSRSTGTTYIIGCQNYGNVSGSDNKTYCGGIVGQGFPKGSLSIIACVNHTRTSGNTYIGGILGYSQGTDLIAACLNEGEIQGIEVGEADNYVGGIAGKIDANSFPESYSTNNSSLKNNIATYQEIEAKRSDINAQIDTWNNSQTDDKYKCKYRYQAADNPAATLPVLYVP